MLKRSTLLSLAAVSILTVFSTLSHVYASDSSSSSANSINTYIAPLGTVVGYFNVAAEFKISDQFSIGPSIGYARLKSIARIFDSSTDIRGHVASYGLSSTWFLSNHAFQDSWIITPSLQYATARSGDKKESGISVGSEFGYGWFWDSGFNIGLGAGFSYLSLDLDKLGIDLKGRVQPVFRLTLGLAF